MIQLSLLLKTGLDYFENMSFFDFRELLKDVEEIERERIPTGNKNSS